MVQFFSSKNEALRSESDKAKIIQKRVEWLFDLNHPKKQTRFGKRYSTKNHIKNQKVFEKLNKHPNDIYTVYKFHRLKKININNFIYYSNPFHNISFYSMTSL